MLNFNDEICDRDKIAYYVISLPNDDSCTGIKVNCTRWSNWI